MVEIVKYKDEYKEDVRRICLLTIAPDLVGQEDYVALQYADYYTTCESDNCFIALVDNKVVGYCLSSLNPKDYKKKYKEETLPKLSKLNKKYVKEAKFSLFVNDLFSMGYTSHLHIDIQDGYHKMGIGKKLIEAQLENLKKKGSKGVHLGCDKKNLNAQGFYKHLGFKTIFDSKMGIIFAMRLNK